MQRRWQLIIVDPGHGGHDPGAVGCGLKEAEINLAVAYELAAVLDSEAIPSRFTRPNNSWVSLKERVRIANELGADLFLSIHCNAFVDPSANGFEVWTSPGDTGADPIATRIFYSMRETFPEMIARQDFSDGDPDKEAEFYVLKHTSMPAVLVELAFLTNWADAHLLSTARPRFARAIADGLVGH